MKICYRDLQNAAFEILRHVGENEENAQIASEIMVINDLRGVSTHGTNLLRMIAKRCEAKMLSLPTKVTVASEDMATSVLDGGDGLGQVAGYKAMNAAIEKARLYGLGMALIRNTNNVGSLGYYVYKTAMQDIAAIMMTNGNPSMAPYGGAEPFLGSNPIAFAVPSSSGMPIILDMSSSVVARGKIRMAALKNEKIPLDWALDSNGKPTSDPQKALKGCLLPVGGPKGSGLAIIVDIFAGILSGSSYGRNLKSFHELEGQTGVGACFIAIDISRFMPVDQFRNLVGEYSKDLKSCRLREGFKEILLPGEIELRKEQESREGGIEMPEEVIDGLNSLMRKAGIGFLLRSMD